jgi:uncharacterized membrane protein
MTRRLTGWIMIALAVFGALNLATQGGGTVDEYSFCALMLAIGYVLRWENKVEEVKR